MNIKNKRVEARNYILKTLNKYSLSENLRGSWQTGDFHFNAKDNTTYSDVDIYINGIGEEKRLTLIDLISRDLMDYFGNTISVSIHNRNSLYEMSISDAQILGVAEYIAQFQKINVLHHCSVDYINSKFTLLLLRQSFKESYSDVSKRINNSSSLRAIDVKYGVENEFPIATAELLVKSYGNNTAIHFFNNCILNKPDELVIKSTLSQLEKCTSIDEWLYNYLVHKINQFEIA